MIDASYYKYTSYYKYIGGKFFAAWLAVVPARAGLLVVGCWRGPCWHVFQVGGVAGWPWVVGLVVGLLFVCCWLFSFRAVLRALFGGG